MVGNPPARVSVETSASWGRMEHRGDSRKGNATPLPDNVASRYRVHDREARALPICSGASVLRFSAMTSYARSSALMICGLIVLVGISSACGTSVSPDGAGGVPPPIVDSSGDTWRCFIRDGVAMMANLDDPGDGPYLAALVAPETREETEWWQACLGAAQSDNASSIAESNANAIEPFVDHRGVGWRCYINRFGWAMADSDRPGHEPTRARSVGVPLSLSTPDPWQGLKDWLARCDDAAPD